MYSNSIVKIERCDGAIEDLDPEVDPFMDISSLRSNVKVEISEGALAHSSVDLKPELPISPVQNEEEFHPGEFLQIKMEESDDQIYSQDTFEPSSEEETENSLEEVDDNISERESEDFSNKNWTWLDENAVAIDQNVLKELETVIGPYSLLSLLKGDMKGDSVLVYLPKYSSIRCDLCFRRWKVPGSKGALISKQGLPIKPINKKRVTISRHLSTTEHLKLLQLTLQPKTEPKSFMDKDTIELIERKHFSHRPAALISTLEADSRGNRSLVYLHNQEALRCERCYKSPKCGNENMRIEFSLKINQSAVNQRILQHFITDQHAEVVASQKILDSEFTKESEGIGKINEKTLKAPIPVPGNSSVPAMKPAQSKANKSNVPTQSDPEVDPFMDISSLGSRVKVEVTEGALAHSSVDLKPELQIPSVQKEEEFHPGEFLQVKIEESEEAIKPETSESSDEDEAENSNSEEEDKPPTGKYKGVLFSDVMEEFTKKYQPIPSLLILLKNEPSLRFLPQFKSVRCELCYLGIIKSGWKIKGSPLSSKNGYKFPSTIYKAVAAIKLHLSSVRHLHFTTDSHNQPDPKESADLDEPGVFINDSILELFKTKFLARPNLLQILESDMRRHQSLVYLPKSKALRCELCFGSKIDARSNKYDFSLGLKGKRGISIYIYPGSELLENKIIRHFNSNEHSAIVKNRNYFDGQNGPKRPKISPPDGAKATHSNSSKSPLDGSVNPLSTPSNPPKSSLDGSSPMEINDDTIKLIKSHQNSTLRPGILNVLLFLKDSSEDRCLVYLPTLKSIRCEICFRDDGIRHISIKRRGDLVREGGMKDFNNPRGPEQISQHLRSQRHLQVLLKQKRNGRDQNSSLPIESPSLINPVNVKIEPRFGPNPMNEGGSDQLNWADSIELPGIVIESVDIKEEKPGI